jgi:ankyrin repeat protein
VPTASLPHKPDLEHLRDDAKALRDGVRSGSDEAIALVREHHPRLGGLTAGSPEATAFRLADAQLALARHYGFASWPRLRRHVELVRRLSRSPHEQPVGGDLPDDAARADELLRLACLNYGADHPDRWRRAAELLAAHPGLAGASIHTAAATGDVAAATAILASDARAARREGGPFGWEPLLYLAYSRLEPEGPGHDFVAVARLLLDHGADPNAGYLWEGLPSPFTVLTGVFGGGEQGAPPHRDELALARLLLDAGAEANDSQTAYDRGPGDIAHDDTEFLELLLDHGLGRGEGGPWRDRLGHEHEAPADVAARLLQHAAEAGLVERARLLLARGVDPNVRDRHPLYRGRGPYECAVVNGNAEVAALLAEAGADTSTVDPLTRFVGALVAGDEAAVDAALVADPGLADRARAEHPALVSSATDLGRPAAVGLLVRHGFDVNHRARTTALHHAALRGDLALVELLVSLGADPSITDTEFDATPQGWAEHSGEAEVVAWFDARSSA